MPSRKERDLDEESAPVPAAIASFELNRRSIADKLAPTLSADEDEAPASRLIVGLFHMPVGAWRELLISATAGVLVEAVTSEPVKAGLTTAAGFTATALRTIKKLSVDELVIFTAMQKLSAGAVYRVWLDRDSILAAVAPEIGAGEATRTLANMKSRGILEEGADKWRAVW